MATITDIEPDEIVEPVRLGKKDEKNQKPRLLCVKITCQQKKDDIIKKAWKINENTKDPKKKV